ncbi:MAG: DMT family protein, partial [Sedimentisphaerales bacterium]|nr:DMT family protein [Sedimentisphaerales bacterium]
MDPVDWVLKYYALLPCRGGIKYNSPLRYLTCCEFTEFKDKRYMKTLFLTSLMLVGSNIFMTFAWYGHL